MRGIFTQQISGRAIMELKQPLWFSVQMVLLVPTAPGLWGVWMSRNEPHPTASVTRISTSSHRRTGIPLYSPRLSTCCLHHHDPFLPTFLDNQHRLPRASLKQNHFSGEERGDMQEGTLCLTRGDTAPSSGSLSLRGETQPHPQETPV